MFIELPYLIVIAVVGLVVAVIAIRKFGFPSLREWFYDNNFPDDD